MLKRKSRHRYYTHKNQLKRNHRLKYKTLRIKLLNVNIKEILHDLGFGNGFFGITPKALSLKKT